MIERLKVCWYVLTKKYYAFYAFDRKKEGDSGAQCFIESKVENTVFFLELIIKYTGLVLNKIKDEKYGKNNTDNRSRV